VEELMDQRTVKLERDDALRQVANLAPRLSLDAQAYLNGKLKELVAVMLARRAAEEKR